MFGCAGCNETQTEAIDKALHSLFEAVISKGEDVKKAIFSESRQYGFNFPNPNLGESTKLTSQTHMAKHQVALIDGGYTDNTGIAASVFYLQEKYLSISDLL